MSLPNVLVQQRQVCPKCKAVFRAGFLRCPTDGVELQALTHDPLTGSVFADRYAIEECVGEGGMGRVYRARHTRVSRLFAIKVLFGDLATDSRMRVRFAQEGEAAGRLSHRNVVSVVDFGETPEGQLYLAMDYVEGPSLESLIREQAPFEVNRAANLLRQLAAGLGHAHSCGLIHRDFKPANVIVTRDDEGEAPKILDFGIARLVETGFDNSLTTEGLVMGTPAYMSPEHSTAGSIDHRTDLFSLGVVLYEMLCGRLPFDGNKFEILQQNAARVPPPIIQRVPGLIVDSRLEAMALELMAKDPRQRFQDSKAVLHEIAEHPGLAPEIRRRAQTLDSIVSSASLDGTWQTDIVGPRINPDGTTESMLLEASRQADLARLQGASSSEQTRIQRAPFTDGQEAHTTEATAIDVSSIAIPAGRSSHGYIAGGAPHQAMTTPYVPTQLVSPVRHGEPRSRRVLWLALAGGLVVAGVLAFVLAGDSGQDDDVLVASGNPLEGNAPSVDAIGAQVDAAAAVPDPPDALAPTASNDAAASGQPDVVQAHAVPADAIPAGDAGTAHVEPAVTVDTGQSARPRDGKTGSAQVRVPKPPRVVSELAFIRLHREVLERYPAFKQKYGGRPDGRRAAQLMGKIDYSRALADASVRADDHARLSEVAKLIDKVMPGKKQKGQK